MFNFFKPKWKPDPHPDIVALAENLRAGDGWDDLYESENSLTFTRDDLSVRYRTYSELPGFPFLKLQKCWVVYVALGDFTWTFGESDPESILLRDALMVCLQRHHDRKLHQQQKLLHSKIWSLENAE